MERGCGEDGFLTTCSCGGHVGGSPARGSTAARAADYIKKHPILAFALKSHTANVSVMSNVM